MIDQLDDLYLTRQSVDGSVDDNWMKGAIEFTRKTLGGAAKEVPPSEVFRTSSSREKAANGFVVGALLTSQAGEAS